MKKNDNIEFDEMKTFLNERKSVLSVLRETKWEFEPDRLLNSKEVSHLLGISRGHLYNMICRGEIVPMRLNKKKKSGLRFSASIIKKLMGDSQCQ